MKDVAAGDNTNSKNIFKVSFIGGIVVVLLLVVGTIFMGHSASNDTSTAVNQVTNLFMDELTSRRQQVVNDTLSTYKNNLRVAVQLMEPEDLSSTEALQSYQSRMKQLYNLEKFAFVDEDGLIYTSMGTRTDIDRYSFDYKNISSIEISLKKVDDNDRKVVIAMPVDRLPFEGKHLIVCFMEIDMDYMLQQLSLQTNTNGITFCNLYLRNGDSLSDNVLGGMASENNLIDALRKAEFEDDSSFAEFFRGFAMGNSGTITFSYNDITETLNYVPIEGTDWMLTYLIRESVITDEISSISNGILIRSVIMSALIAIVLAFMFIILIKMTKHNAKLQLDQETQETMQQEMEERLHLQDELLKHEQKRNEANQMITAMAADYRSVYYVDLDRDDATCYRNESGHDDIGGVNKHFPYLESFTDYANKYVDEDYRDEFLSFIDPVNIRKALDEQEIIVLRYLTHRDGADMYEMLRMAAVRRSKDRDDKTIHALGVGFTDIDEDMRDSLAKSQALSDALKAAEEASNAKTVFLSNMSHEIRTPMNAIIGLDSLALNEENVPDNTREYLTKIGANAQHLLTLINDILDMSRIESGRMTLHNDEFAMSGLLEQLNTTISGQCQEKGINYNCRVIGHIDDYYIGDGMKIRQMLINILSNAVKFTPPDGNVELSVERTSQFEGKSVLQFKIADTGIGMSEEFLPTLFESFSQEDATAANKYGSSGLGMAITKNIVEMMNGKIEVESKKGEGTTFTVTVTLLDSDKKDNDNDDDIEISPHDMNVLVIDDDKVALDHAKMVLDNMGFDAESTLSGAEAVEMVKLRHARQEPYDLIVVDWKMPDMDGVEVTRKIREVTGDESAIIILTAYNWEDVLDEATDAGVDSFISKPLFANNLIEQFKAALKKKINEEANADVKADLTGRRILLAEDMEINAEIMIALLETRDMTCEHALDGQIAVDMYSGHEAGYYDAILMDMRMPNMNGLEATEAIRAMDKQDAKTIPIIALTANAFDEDVQRSLQAGLNAHLSKPVDPDLLFETMEHMIKP